MPLVLHAAPGDRPAASKPATRSRWLWAVCAFVFVLSIGAAGAILALADGPPMVRAPVGFDGEVDQQPRTGAWRASGTINLEWGYAGPSKGDAITDAWTIARRCLPPPCRFELTRQLGERSSQTARMDLAHDGWRVRFPVLVLPCGPNHPNEMWSQNSSWVFRFTQGGHAAQAHEVNRSWASCGFATSRVDWKAEHTG